MKEQLQSRIVYSNRSHNLGLLIFALVWCGLGSLITWVFVRSHTTPWRWLMLLIPVAGIVFLYSGVRLAILGFRHPELVLILDKVPLRPGERFHARIETTSIPDGRIRASIHCVRGVGRESEQEIWSDAHNISRHEVKGDPLRIPIDFKVPIDALETSERDEIAWRIALQIGDAPDMAGYFVVPVFAHEC